VSKKVYKKKKKVKEITIYKRTHFRRRINVSMLSLFLLAFLVPTIFYYLNVWFFINNTTPLAMKYIGLQVGRIHIFSDGGSTFVPFSAGWKNKMLDHKQLTVLPVYKNKLGPNTKNMGSDQIIWHGSRDKKEVALTFDADMTPVMVDWLHDGQVSNYDDTRITNYLTQNQIKATFFLTGLWIESYPDATKELADNSLFELENHSYSHPSMAGDCFGQPQVPQSQYPYEIEKTQQLIEQFTHQTPKYFRFPGGCYDQSDLDLVKKEGLVTVHWDDVADDGFNDNEDNIINNVLSEAKPGSIIVLHMGGATTNTPQTANALPIIIDGLKKDGYSFVTVNELLNPPKIATITPKEYLTSLESFQTLSP
jgi:peptidoglycan-N-acetylglucosamine deacetylase